MLVYSSIANSVLEPSDAIYNYQVTVIQPFISSNNSIDF